MTRVRFGGGGQVYHFLTNWVESPLYGTYFSASCSVNCWLLPWISDCLSPLTYWVYPRGHARLNFTSCPNIVSTWNSRVSTNVRLTRGELSISVELGREPPPYGAKLILLYLALSTLFAVSLGCLMACLHYRVYPRVRSWFNLSTNLSRPM
jgi:hypothetical protein